MKRLSPMTCCEICAAVVVRKAGSRKAGYVARSPDSREPKPATSIHPSWSCSNASSWRLSDAPNDYDLNFRSASSLS
eukprot:scaffold199895_cov17-Prasinocladus_malaysianus.AAC.1